MTTRTTETTMTFRRPFRIDGFDEPLPAGDYRVETDEEQLDGVSRPAYRRVLTILHVPGIQGTRDLGQSLAVDPDALDAALAADSTE